MDTAPESPSDLSRLCIHTVTTKPWPIEKAVPAYAAAGAKGITVWRDALESRDVSAVARSIGEAGLAVVSLCRGGFFPGVTDEARRKALDDNRRAIEEARALGAPHVVLVCGAVPGLPLPEARRHIRDGIGALLPDCASAGVKLAIEPLHPMYADSRSAINTMKQANDLCAEIDSEWIGVAADVYHLWWDPDLKTEIERCGAMGRLFAFHVCDWKTPTVDLLLDRGLMGEGCIPIRQIRGWVEAAGFSGYNEVEIFSNRYWAEDQDTFLRKIIHAYRDHV